MKDNFLLKKTQGEVFKELSDEEAGKLIKGIFDYVATGECDLTGSLKAIFIPIKKDIDKNEFNYQKICERNKENINKRWSKSKENLPNDTTVYESIPEVYESVPEDTDARHISHITNHNSYITNHEKDNKGVIGGKEEKTKVEVLDSKQTLYVDIIGYLNAKTGSNYKATTPKTKQLIQARLKEGFTLDDFKTVIDTKCLDWLKNNDMKKYLRPETLFGTKFESYLNQPQKELTTKDLPFQYWDF